MGLSRNIPPTQESGHANGSQRIPSSSRDEVPWVGRRGGQSFWVISIATRRVDVSRNVYLGKSTSYCYRVVNMTAAVFLEGNPPPLDPAFFTDRSGGDERPVFWEGSPLLSEASSGGNSISLRPEFWPIRMRDGGGKGLSPSATRGGALIPSFVGRRPRRVLADRRVPWALWRLSSALGFNKE